MERVNITHHTDWYLCLYWKISATPKFGKRLSHLWGKIYLIQIDFLPTAMHSSIHLDIYITCRFHNILGCCSPGGLIFIARTSFLRLFIAWARQFPKATGLRWGLLMLPSLISLLLVFLSLNKYTLKPLNDIHIWRQIWTLHSVDKVFLITEKNWENNGAVKMDLVTSIPVQYMAQGMHGCT